MIIFVTLALNFRLIPIWGVEALYVYLLALVLRSMREPKVGHPPLFKRTPVA